VQISDNTPDGAVLLAFDPLFVSMGRRAVAGWGNELADDAAQTARIAFARGLEASRELSPGLRICYARACARKRLRNWTRNRFARRRSPFLQRSLDEPLSPDGGCLLDILARPAADPGPDAGDVDRMLSSLREMPARERDILGKYYWERKTMGQIAGEMGMSRQRVQQILASALEVLRRKIGENRAFAFGR
jgi:RNA polymerase sigma factor (sigma-70 family)